MQISERGLALIKSHEGFSAYPYICPAGKLTVGYGHVIRKGEDFGKGISRIEAQKILQADLWAACASVRRLVRVPLTQNQFDALVSFTFNLGGGRLQSSTLRQKLNREDYEGAAGEFRKWVFGGGRKLPGLIRRRADETALFNSGTGQEVAANDSDPAQHQTKRFA